MKSLKKVVKSIVSLLIPYRIRKLIFFLFGDTLKSFDAYKKNMFSHISTLREIGFYPSHVIDVGAYHGMWTKEVFTIFPESCFLMVEPQASKQLELEKVASASSKMSYEIALLGESIKDDVKFYEMETGSSIYEENTAFPRNVNYLKMTTLDNLISKKNAIQSCFLKLDVQGAEIDVLKGARKVLENTEFILLEVSTLNYNEKAPLFADIIKYLESIGFILFDICDERRKENNILFQLDIIFIKKQSEYRKKVDFTNKASISNELLDELHPATN